MDYILIGVLVCLLLGQQVFYMVVVHKLVNKLMSRNYYDYVATQNVNKDVKKAEKPSSKDVLVDEAEYLEDLNKQFGIL